MPSYVYRDGQMQQVPDTVITESTDLREKISNSLVVKEGATATTWAGVRGTITVEGGGVLDARGPVNGTVSVQAGGIATFYSRVSGTLQVSPGGRAKLTSNAVAVGTMHIEGDLLNEGTRGVQVRGSSNIYDAPGSTIRQPDEVRSDGTVVYYG